MSCSSRQTYNRRRIRRRPRTLNWWRWVECRTLGGDFSVPNPTMAADFRTFESPALPDIEADDAPQRLHVVDVVAKLVVGERRIVIEQVDDVECHLCAARGSAALPGAVGGL